MMLNMTFSKADLDGTSCCLSSAAIFSQRPLLSAGLAMGIAFLITTALSIGAIIQRNHVTIGLVVLNWVLISDAIIVLVVGTFVWFYTLRERAEYHVKYGQLQPSQRIAVQDMVSRIMIYLQSDLLTCLNCDQFSCCGYFNSSDLVVIGGNFCQNQTFVDTLNATATNNFCVTPITHHVDVSLNDVFSYVETFLSTTLDADRSCYQDNLWFHGRHHRPLSLVPLCHKSGMYIIISATFLDVDCICRDKNSSVSGGSMQSVEAEDLFETNIIPFFRHAAAYRCFFLYTCRVVFHPCLVGL